MNLKPDKTLCFVVLFTFVIGLIPFCIVDYIDRDACLYIWSAQAISTGNWPLALQHFNLPGAPLCISIAQKFTGDWIVAGKLVSLVAMTLLAIPFYLLARDIFGEKHAVLSTLFLATCPYLRMRTAFIGREPIFLLLSFCTLLGLYKILDRKHGYWAVVIPCAILATLTRIEGVVLFLCIFLTILFQAICQKSWKKVALIGAVAIGGILLFWQYSHLSPRSTIIAEILAEPAQYLDKMEVFRVRDSLKEFGKISLSRFDKESYFAEVARYAIFVLYAIGWSTDFFATMFYSTCCIAFLGLFRHLRETFTTKLGMVALAGVIFALSSFVLLLAKDLLSRRYLLSAIAIFCLWTGPGVCYLIGIVKKRFSFRYLSKALVVTSLIIPTIYLINLSIRESGKAINIVEAGQWIKREYPADVPICTNEKRVLLYAGIPTNAINKTAIFVRLEDNDKLLAKAEELHSTVAVVKHRRHQKLPAKNYLARFPGKRFDIVIFRTNRDLPQIIQAGEWIKARYPADVPILTNDRRILRYAGIPSKNLRKTAWLIRVDTPKVIFNRAKMKNVELIALKCQKQIPTSHEYIAKFPGPECDIIIFRCPP